MRIHPTLRLIAAAAALTALSACADATAPEGITADTGSKVTSTTTTTTAGTGTDCSEMQGWSKSCQ